MTNNNVTNTDTADINFPIDQIRSDSGDLLATNDNPDKYWEIHLLSATNSYKGRSQKHREGGCQFSSCCLENAYPLIFHSKVTPSPMGH